MYTPKEIEKKGDRVKDINSVTENSVAVMTQEQSLVFVVAIFVFVVTDDDNNDNDDDGNVKILDLAHLY
jgi:hypothetical protein